MHLLLTSALIAVSILGGCTSTSPTAPVSSTQGSTWIRKGIIIEVRDMTENDGSGAVIGSVAGTVLGSLAGSNLGSGAGRALATIGGAAAGGLAGHSIGQASSARSYTRLTIRSDDGQVGTYHAQPGEGFKVGEEVKIVSQHGTVRITR